MARRDPVIIRGEKRGRPGRWLVHFYHAPGKRTWRTFRTREAADQFRLEVFKTRAGDPNGQTDYTTTVGGYAKDAWLPQVKATTKRLSARRYETAWRIHVLPAFENHKVRLLTRAQIKRLLITKLGEGYARPTVTLILSTVRSLLNSALEDGIITSNPSAKLGRALKLEAPPEGNVNEQVKAFTREELARFFKAATQAPWPCGPLFWVLALTGARVGEGIALRWSDLDVSQRSLHIQRSMSEGLLSTPKSGRDRLVSLSERAAKVLQRLQMTRVDRAKRLKSKTPPEYIFTTREGTPPSKYSIRVAFIDVLERAGLPEHHTPHSLRHTYATLLLQHGESLKFVQEQLGHSSIKLTADLYGKWARTEPMRGGANYLDAMTRPQTDSTSGLKILRRATNGPQTGAIDDGSTKSCSSSRRT